MKACVPGLDVARRTQYRLASRRLLFGQSPYAIYSELVLALDLESTLILCSS